MYQKTKVENIFAYFNCLHYLKQVKDTLEATEIDDGSNGTGKVATSSRILKKYKVACHSKEKPVNYANQTAGNINEFLTEFKNAIITDSDPVRLAPFTSTVPNTDILIEIPYDEKETVTTIKIYVHAWSVSS